MREFKIKPQRKWLALLSFLFLVVSFQNCSAIRSPYEDSSTSSSVSATSQSDLVNQKAVGILSSRCYSCHNPDNPQGNISNILDLNYLQYYRLVIPGQPEISDIIRVIKEGSMPPNGSLSTDDLQTLNKWIAEGLIDSEGVTLPGGSAQLEATFASISARIIGTRCLSCHNAANANGGVNLSTYNGVRATVVPGNPGGSSLVTSVERPGANYMPRNGARLSQDEISKMREWIQNGAANN